MKILDRYIAKGFFYYFGMSVISFSALYLLVDVIQRSLKFGMTLTLVEYSLLQIPFIISQMVPIACLIGSLFVLNTLSKNSELIAMHACGISLYRISTTLLSVSLLMGITNFFLTDIIVPPTIRKSRYLLQREIKGDKDFHIFKTQRLWYRSENSIYNFDYFNPDSKVMEGVQIYLFDANFEMTEQIHAQRAVFEQDLWKLEEGVSITFIDDFPVAHAFHEKLADYIKEKPKNLKEISQVETLSYLELKNYIERNQQAGFNTLRHEVNLHAKISYAIACLVMAFLGIPFSARSHRSGSLAMSSAVGLTIAFCYWMSLNAGLSFGYSGTLPPMVSAWITNVLFAGIGFYLLHKRQQMKLSWLS